MANFYGAARSNYFEVKNPQAFLAWVETVSGLGCWKADPAPIQSEESEAEKQRRNRIFKVYSTDGDTGCWPSTIEDDNGDFVDFDLVTDMAPHLADGQVAVLMESGAEKLRYVCGNAVAFTNEGKVVQVNLDDIYKKATEAFGVSPGPATY